VTHTSDESTLGVTMARHPPIVMFLAKAFQKDIRPRLEAKTLAESGRAVLVFAWDRYSEFPSISNVDGASVRSLRPLSFKSLSRFQLALGAMAFQLLLFFEAMRLVNRIRERPIVHAHDFNTLVPACILKIFRLSHALVYDCHELSYAAYSELFNDFMGKVVRVVEEHCAKYADEVITVSEPVAAYLRQFNEDTEILYNYPRTEDIPRLTKNEARQRLGLELDAFIVSHVGEIRYDSTVQLLLDVAALAGKTENIHFLVVGGGPSAPTFWEAVKGVHDVRLTVVPYVPRPTALSYTLASDLTWAVYQSRSASKENPRMTLPWKLFDSLACGVPVVVEKDTLRARLVEKLACGIVLQRNDPSYVLQAIVSVSKDHNRWYRMSLAAKEAVINMGFDWRHMSRKLNSIYDRL